MPTRSLSQNVVIKMDCFLPLQGSVPVCTVLRADEAEYNEETGEIQAGRLGLNQSLWTSSHIDRPNRQGHLRHRACKPG